MLASNGAAEWVADCLKSQASFDLFEMLAAPQMLASLERVLEPSTLQVVTGKLSSRQLLALSDMQNFDNMPISSQRAERWSTGRNAMISELGKGKQQPLPSMVYRS